MMFMYGAFLWEIQPFGKIKIPFCPETTIYIPSVFIQATVKLPPEKFVRKNENDPQQELPTEPKKIQLNSSDELFAVIRDKNFNAVGPELSRKAKILSAQYEVGLVE